MKGPSSFAQLDITKQTFSRWREEQGSLEWIC